MIFAGIAKHIRHQLPEKGWLSDKNRLV